MRLTWTHISRGWMKNRYTRQDLQISWGTIIRVHLQVLGELCFYKLAKGRSIEYIQCQVISCPKARTPFSLANAVEVNKRLSRLLGQSLIPQLNFPAPYRNNQTFTRQRDSNHDHILNATQDASRRKGARSTRRNPSSCNSTP